MSRATRPANARRSQPSRAPERKRERRVIRRFLRVAAWLAFAETFAQSPEESSMLEASMELDAAEAALSQADAMLSTLDGFHSVEG